MAVLCSITIYLKEMSHVAAAQQADVIHAKREDLDKVFKARLSSDLAASGSQCCRLPTSMLHCC